LIVGLAAPAIGVAGEEPDAPLAKIEPEVLVLLQAGKQAKVMIRVAAKNLVDQVNRETDAIYADPATDTAQKKALNDAAYARHRQRLSDLKRAVISDVAPGIDVVGQVPSGPEIIAIVSSLQALKDLVADPRIERVFLERRVSIATAAVRVVEPR